MLTSAPYTLFDHLPHLSLTVPTTYSYVVGLWIWISTSAGFAVLSLWHASYIWHMWMELLCSMLLDASLCSQQAVKFEGNNESLAEE